MSYELPDAPPPIPDDGRICYYGRDREAFPFLSHFFPSPIELDGIVWPTVEHYYQAQKSTSGRYKRAILAAESPGLAKRLAARPETTGRAKKYSWFRANDAQPRADWHDVKLDIMRVADRAKFTQHPALRAALLATGEAELIEDSPAEPYWGIGPDGLGLNWAGRVIMEIRERLRSGEGPVSLVD
jgi:ribA/ribD-fused uncharacterized protein